jgi:peptidoglycan/xylan/chitin deacetylase (PgdA/CDA1 family)
MENAFSFSRLQVSSEMMKTRFGALTLEEIDVMKSKGNKIGCHSVHHDILSKLDDEALVEEIRTSEGYLETLFNTKIFSYPFGGKEEVNRRTIHQLERSRFSHAFMNIDVPDFAYGRYALPRMALPNTSDPYLIDAKLSGFEYFLKYRKLLPDIKGFL